jgi:hypothetical protein
MCRKFHICIYVFCIKIAQLDQSSSFVNAVEQVAMVKKTLSEIRLGKELYQSKSNQILGWILTQYW